MDQINYSEDQSEACIQASNLRQKALLVLFKHFGNGDYSNQSIYECADDWVKRQYTTSGLVKYYESYYTTGVK